MPRTSTDSSSRSRARPGPAAETERTLVALGVRPSRRLGQSFLVDPFVADAEAALVGTSSGRVVEIGGGLGMLTEALLRKGVEPLTVVEKDPRLARHLANRFSDRATIVTADALELDLPPARCVVGNLPFSVATPILLRLLARRVPTVVALVQREVAERLAAQAGSSAYGRMSILAKLYGDVELFQVVPSTAFSPVPEVEGRILVHRAREGPLPVPDVARLESLTASLFQGRRKQLKNLLPAAVGGPERAERLARLSDWPTDWSTRRPETLPPESFFALARVVVGDSDGRGA